jgi:transcription termination factor Rho
MGRRNDKFQKMADKLKEYTPIQPDERIYLETDSDEITGRVLDVVAPIGKGQRVLVTSPPKAGKTTILQKISKAVEQNHPEIKQYALLINERPEEATDFRRNLSIEVEASTTDQSPKNHADTAENVFVQGIEAMMEGKDVLVLLDSITRLARAYNKLRSGSGRTLSGGITAGALDRPRQLFGVARNLEGSGSMTIVASALVDTGSRMDDVIFQEFKGTGNSEIVLDRFISERRIYPAVNIAESGTRNEQALVGDMEGEKINVLRRKLADLEKVEALEMLIKQMKNSPSNLRLLRSVKD